MSTPRIVTPSEDNRKPDARSAERSEVTTDRLIEQSGNAEASAPINRPIMPDDTIHVGAGGKLIIPREEIEEIDPGEDLGDLAKKPLRKPGRREWIGGPSIGPLRQTG